MRKILIFSLFTLLFVACQNRPENPEPKLTQHQEKIKVYIETHPAVAASELGQLILKNIATLMPYEGAMPKSPACPGYYDSFNDGGCLYIICVSYSGGFSVVSKVCDQL